MFRSRIEETQRSNRRASGPPALTPDGTGAEPRGPERNGGAAPHPSRAAQLSSITRPVLMRSAGGETEANLLTSEDSLPLRPAMRRASEPPTFSFCRPPACGLGARPMVDTVRIAVLLLLVLAGVDVAARRLSI